MKASPLAADLRQVNRGLRSLLQPSPAFLSPLRRHVLQSEGKQQRSKLLLILGALCGASRQLLITAAAGVESVHLATLIHDDILDGATRRRSRGALHLSQGASAALLYGDFIFARGVAAVNSLGNPRLTDLLLSTVADLCAGEILESKEAGKFPWSERTYYRIAELKTGALFQFACEAGGILAGVGGERRFILRRFGKNLGFFYQIADDCLDCAPRHGTPEKDRLLDLKNKVPSFPLIFAAGNGKSYAAVRGMLSPRGKKGLEHLAGLLRERGCVLRSAARALEHLAEAESDAATIKGWASGRINQGTPLGEGTSVAARLLDEFLGSQRASLDRIVEQ